MKRPLGTSPYALEIFQSDFRFISNAGLFADREEFFALVFGHFFVIKPGPLCWRITRLDHGGGNFVFGHVSVRHIHGASPKLIKTIQPKIQMHAIARHPHFT